MMSRLSFVVLLATTAILAGTADGAAQSVPVPRPFPGAGASTAPAPRGAPVADPPPVAGTPSPAVPPRQAVPTLTPSQDVGPDIGDVPIYPTADYLDSFDAGHGQRYYLYGTNTAYDAVVTFYRSVLRDGGREIYKEPAMRQFELGRFRDDRMAYPPSIVVKDYSSNDSPGYLYVSGTSEVRYKTIIQVVPPDPSDR